MQKEDVQARVEQAYYEHGTHIQNVLWQRLGNREVVQDLLQETFLRALRYLKATPREDMDEIPFSWLATIATRLVIDYYRRWRRTLALSLSQLEDGSDEHGWTGEWSVSALIDSRGEHNPEERVLVREKLEEVFEGLSPKDRAIFCLLDYGYSSEEVKQQVGTTPKTRIYRVRKHLANKTRRTETLSNRE